LKKNIAIISILLIITIGLFAYFKIKKTIKPSDCVETTGLIEATEVGLGPKIAGRIDWLCCKEGDSIKAGELAIRLDDKELKARVLQGRKSLKAEEAFLHISNVNLENARLEIDAARAEVQTAKADADRANTLAEDAKKTLRRVSGLFKDGLISEKEMDVAKTNYDANKAQLDSVMARKRTADVKLKISLSSIKVFEAQVSSAIANVEESQAALSVLESQLKDTETSSPIDGVVVYKAFETGEVVNAGSPVYTIHDLKNIWARVDIEETKIGNIRLGNRAKITVLAMQDKELNGEVIEIGREGEFATQRDVTRGKSDIRTFRVKIGIIKSDGLLKSGMTISAQIFCR